METTENVTMVAHEAGCPECAERAASDTASNETSMAFLLAILPVMVLTFFGQVGLL